MSLLPEDDRAGAVICSGTSRTVRGLRAWVDWWPEEEQVRRWGRLEWAPRIGSSERHPAADAQMHARVVHAQPDNAMLPANTRARTTTLHTFRCRLGVCARFASLPLRSPVSPPSCACLLLPAATLPRRRRGCTLAAACYLPARLGS